MLLFAGDTPLYLRMRELGFASKKANKVSIPEKLLILEWEKLKNLIKGVFDADGTIFAHKKDNYKYPYIGISSQSNKLIQQLYRILREKGYPVYISNDNLFMKGIKNVNMWMSDIGSSNPKHIFKYEEWITLTRLQTKVPIQLLI